MTRILSLWLPQWPLQRRFPGAFRPDAPPAVLYARSSRGEKRVAYCSDSAIRRGVGRELPVAEAVLGLSEPFELEPYDPAAARESLVRLAHWCDRYTPRVGIEDAPDPETLFLDLTGCAHLFGGEEPLAVHLHDALRQFGFVCRVAVADSIGAAWAVAHAGRQGDSPICVVPPGRERLFLAPLPLHGLRLAAPLLSRLHELGVRTVRDLLRIPRDTLPARFGPQLLERLDQALGERPEPLVPLHPPEPVQARREFEEPLQNLRGLQHVLRELLEQITEQLRTRRQGVQRLECRLEPPGQTAFDCAIGLTRPAQSPAYLFELLQLQLERGRIPDEISGITLHAAWTAPLEFQQQTLFAPEDAHRRELQTLLDRLSNRLGAAAVVRPRLVPDPVPERGVDAVPCVHDGAVRAETAAPPVAHSRPLTFLAEPLPVEVTRVGPDGPPGRVLLERRLHTVHRAWGPERITSGWWRAEHLRRDYFQVETTTGRRCWLFHDLSSDHWFLHGEFS